MIKIDIPQGLIKQHRDAVMARVRMSFNEKYLLSKVHDIGASSIEDFIEADVERMREWVNTCSDKLKFEEFVEIYRWYFSNGDKNYVADGYNAYTFLEMLGVEVCPYCDDEYIDIVVAGGKKKRTSEVDHFFPKSRYPALAMCIYNLVPSGQVCNGEKKAFELGANPYETDIESWTFLYPDIPVGVSMETVPEECCRIVFHEKQGMVSNVERLLLEQRYARHSEEVKRLLTNLQRLTDEKMDEIVKMGIFGSREEIIAVAFGPQEPNEKKKTLRQKMLRDLTGY